MTDSNTRSSSALLCGYYGAMNIGDEAILYSTLSRISPIFSKTFVSSVDPAQTSEIHKVPTIPTFTQEPLTWISNLREVDELIIGGGGLLEPKNTVKYSIMVSLAVLTQTKVSWYCVGVSPSSNRVDELMYRSIIEASHYVSVRDARSQSELRTAGVASNIDIIPDPAFRKGVLPLTAVETPSSYICVVLRKCEWKPIDTDTLATALDRIVRNTDTPILFTPFEDRRGDWKTIQETQDMMEEDSLVYDGDITVGYMNYLIKNSDLVIGMRLHSIILAAANEVPSVTLSYAEKCDQITSQIYDGPVLDCSQFTDDDLVEQVLDRIQGIPNLSKRAAKLRENAGSISPKREYTKVPIKYKLRLILLTTIAVINWTINHKWRSN